jgi:hypothetical protein
MMTDEELKVRGVRALIAALGDIEAERFVRLLTRAPFDYTKWERTLWPDVSVEELSRQAMSARHGSEPFAHDPEEALRSLRGTVVRFEGSLEPMGMEDWEPLL